MYLKQEWNRCYKIKRANKSDFKETPIIFTPGSATPWPFPSSPSQRSPHCSAVGRHCRQNINFYVDFFVYHIKNMGRHCRQKCKFFCWEKIWVAICLPWVFEGSAKSSGWRAVPEDISRHESHTGNLQRSWISFCNIGEVAENPVPHPYSELKSQRI